MENPTKTAPRQNNGKLAAVIAATETNAPPKPSPVPQAKPRARPTLDIDQAAGTVATAVPTTNRDSGSVASAGVGARSWPTMPPKVTNEIVAVMATICATSRIAMLRFSNSARIWVSPVAP